MVWRREKRGVSNGLCLSAHFLIGERELRYARGEPAVLRAGYQIIK